MSIQGERGGVLWGPNNTSPFRITAAAGMKFARAFSSSKVSVKNIPHTPWNRILTLNKWKKKVKVVHLHRQWNSSLVVRSGRSFWPQLSGKMTHQLHQFLFIQTCTSRASLRTFIIRHCRVRRALQGDQQGGWLQPHHQCLSHPEPIWASQMCLQQEQHNSQQRHQQEQHQRREGEIQSCSQRADTVATHSNLNPGNCHQLSNPHVMTAYKNWAANQSTAKKALFRFFFEELKKVGGRYSQVWMCWVSPSRRC